MSKLDEILDKHWWNDSSDTKYAKQAILKLMVETVEELFCPHHPKKTMEEGGCDTNETLLGVIDNLKKLEE